MGLIRNDGGGSGGSGGGLTATQASEMFHKKPIEAVSTGFQTIGSPPNSIPTYIQGGKNLELIIPSNGNGDQHDFTVSNPPAILGGPSPDLNGFFTLRISRGSASNEVYFDSTVEFLTPAPDFNLDDTEYFIYGMISNGIARVSAVSSAPIVDELDDQPVPVVIVGSPGAGFTAQSNIDLEEGRSYTAGPTIFEANPFDFSITGEGAFFIKIDKGVNDTQPITFGGATIVGNSPDLSQANKKFLVSGTVSDSGDVTIVIHEENPAPVGGATYTPRFFNAFTEFTAGAFALTDSFVRVQNQAAATVSTLPLTFDPVTGVLAATADITLEFAFHAIVELTGTDRASTTARIMKNTPGDSLPAAPVAGGEDSAYTVRLLTSVPRGSVQIPYVRVSLVAGDELFVEIKKLGQPHDLRSFRMSARA